MYQLQPLNASGHLHEQTDRHNQYDAGTLLAPCSNCGAERRAGVEHANCGLCRTCYRRWLDAGYPDAGVPERRCGGRGWRLNEPGMLDDFARMDRKGEPGRSAYLAQYFGVSRRTLSRWRREIERREQRAQTMMLLWSVTGRGRWRHCLRGMTRSEDRHADPIVAVVAAYALDEQASGARRVACFRA
jgi:hypothetical protein